MRQGCDDRHPGAVAGILPVLLPGLPAGLAVTLVPDLLKLAGVVTLSTFAAQMDATVVDAAPGVAGRSAQRR